MNNPLHRTRVINNVHSEAVIRWHDYYIHVLETNKGLELAWTTNPSLIDVPVREFLIAKEMK